MRFVLPILILVLTGCIGLKSAEKRLIASGRVAELSAELYPAQYRAGDTVRTTDTINFVTEGKIDTVRTDSIVYITVTLPGTIQRIIDKREVHDTVLDVAAIETARRKLQNVIDQNILLIGKIEDKNRELAKTRKSRNAAWALFSAGGIAAAIIILLKLKT